MSTGIGETQTCDFGCGITPVAESPASGVRCENVQRAAEVPAALMAIETRLICDWCRSAVKETDATSAQWRDVDGELLCMPCQTARSEVICGARNARAKEATR